MNSQDKDTFSLFDSGMAEPVLILMPTGRDAAVTGAYLHEAGMRPHICHSLTDFCTSLAEAAAGLIAAEALPVHARDVLLPALARQPLWSDVPLLLLTTPAVTTEAMWQFVQELGAVGNVMLLERPLHRVTLLSTLRIALRSRRRQHEVRQLHAERERHITEQTAVLEQLHASDKALRRLNETLEQRVANRTAVLERQTRQLQDEMATRQRMQEALFQQEKLAALGTLLANVAHELNNPLSVATMQLDILQEEGNSGAWTENLETLRQAVERCQSVVQSCLALARQQTPTRQAVALDAVIDDVLILLGHALDVDGITVERHLADDLPKLWADPHQLQHVVANLLTNAHHALRHTAPPRHLRLTRAAHADRSQVILEVSDSGPGIPEDVQHRVFEPFFTTKPQGVGTGLGLPLCRNIVEGHGGTIHLASQPGHGTTVSIILPAATSEVRLPEAPPEPSEPVQTRRATILLIDDEPSVQRALRQLLQRSGHDITTATNGREGLAALEGRSYEVILCDMHMPVLDGPGFYRELEHCHPHLVSRLIKPFKAQEVRRVIQQMLEAR